MSEARDVPWWGHPWQRGWLGVGIGFAAGAMVASGGMALTNRLSHTGHFWSTDGFRLLVWTFPAILATLAFTLRQGWVVVLGAFLAPIGLTALPWTHCWAWDCRSSLAGLGMTGMTLFNGAGSVTGALLGVLVRQIRGHSRSPPR